MQKQQGIGLIEVVIAMAVVAFGLVAIASLQSGLISGSGDNKTRSEALVLAEKKLEELRNNAEIGTLVDTTVDECVGVNIGIAGYKGVCSATAAETIAGTNASFTRNWTVTPKALNRKHISINVGWTGSDGVSDSINVVGEIAWINPADSAFYATISGQGMGAAPSPKQNTFEKPSNILGSDMAITAGGAAGVGSSLTVSAPNPDAAGTISITVYQVAPGSHYYTATHVNANVVLNQIEVGGIAVFLCTTTGCTHLQDYFGGVINTIKGTIYSAGTDLTNIQPAWSSGSSADCYKSTITSSGGVNSMTYECVVGGNCNAMTSSRTRTASGDDATNVGCFVTSVVSDDQINNLNVGPGGEFGNVGLLGVDDRGGDRQLVCFLEDTGASGVTSNPLLDASAGKALNASYLLPVTKRSYGVRRVSSDGTSNKIQVEGINRSYTNHNFLIVDRKTGNSTKEECGIQAVAHSLPLAPRQVTRVLDESDNNLVESTTAYNGIAGQAVSITGTSASSNTNLELFIPEIGACYVNRSNGNDYACVVPKGTSTTVSTTNDGEVTTVETQIMLGTGVTTVTTTDDEGSSTATPTTATSTVTIKGASTAHSTPTDPDITTQTFASCSAFPSGDCNWTANYN